MRPVAAWLSIWHDGIFDEVLRRSGRAKLSTRFRLADTQTIVAIAELSDGSFWSASADVIVTLAACVEELG